MLKKPSPVQIVIVLLLVALLAYLLFKPIFYMAVGILLFQAFKIVKKKYHIVERDDN